MLHPGWGGVFGAGTPGCTHVPFAHTHVLGPVTEGEEEEGLVAEQARACLSPPSRLGTWCSP